MDACPSDWLKLMHFFDQNRLCDISNLFQAHLDWLDSRVIEEETGVLNSAYN